MSMQDPIADAITRLRNAQRAGHTFASLMKSQLNTSLLQLLQEEGYIEAYQEDEENREIKVALKYHHGNPVIAKITRVSKPSRRVYVKAKDIKQVLGGLGISIISTNKGLMTDRNARENNLGGEILINVE
jgi:small subunit ribosomal protein S8